MKFNVGIVTSKMKQTKHFYSEVLNFEVAYENEFYLLMKLKDSTDLISFLLPNHPTQNEIFQSPFNGHGIYLTFEVDDVDELYSKISNKGVAIAVELRDEPWGDRHFAVQDPNGVSIDFVHYQKPD
ncbi:VOC family protein [Marinicella meishanensis]|uniref:VOC family protein n=1 Tax=Marinicella meishanensis TaxID=2873263 RepID=UPI001CBFC595|nr:VOC family protein [Marinicella sp. NBU2979]